MNHRPGQRFDTHRGGPAASPETLIVCPSCAGCAVVRPMTVRDGPFRAACSACAWATTLRDDVYECRAATVGADGECFELWLKGSFRGQPFWAYNYAMLAWMRRLVAASLRERHRIPGVGWTNRSLDSRLPRWMLSRKNRRGVLRAIARLERERSA